MQFTGAIYKRSTGKTFMKGKRQDYVIDMRYLGREFTIDPLDAATHQHVAPPNYAAYINEPSPPPFARMTNARHESTQRNVLILQYDHKRAVVRVEFADGTRTEVPPEDLSTEVTRNDTTTPYRANCAWFDFPVPLTDLYRKTRVKDNGICVYTRTSLHACTVTFRGADEIVAAFEAHTNQAYSFEMRRDRVGKIAVGDVLTLRDERMYEFLDRLINIAIPRVRDFRGISPKQFDGRGNFAMGVTEQIIFPEIDYDQIDKLRGMDITISTTAVSDEQGRALLAAFNFPFRS